MKKLLLTLAATGLSLAAGAHPYKPGDAQSQPILIKGATVHTVSQGVLQNSDVLFSDGKISQVGQGLQADNAKVIDASGKHVYPGLITLASTLGLVEVEAVRATRDSNEVGDFNPEVQGHIAFNTDSDIIPTVRSNGITHAQVMPNGGGIAGRSSLLHLDGWSWEDALVKADLGLHMSWPQVAVRTAWWEHRSPAEQKKAMQKQRQQVQQVFDKARAYAKLRAADDNAPIDVRYQAMLPTLQGKSTLFVHADDARQIEQAVHFAKQESLKLAIIGGADAWRVKDLLAKAQVPVIYTHAYGLPRRSDEDHLRAFRTPAELDQAGVKVAIGIQSSWASRDLPWALGQTVSYGMNPERALRMNTLVAAELLGVADKLGSIEPGKSASLIITNGDLFDYLTNDIQHVFIDGREVDLNNRQKTLYHKYQQKKLN